MSITVVFDPPLPSDSPATFNQKAFTLLGDLNTWSGQANQVAGGINADKTALLNAGLSTVAANIVAIQNAATNAAASAAYASMAQATNPDTPIRLNPRFITAAFTVPAAYNGASVGPISI